MVKIQKKTLHRGLATVEVALLMLPLLALTLGAIEYGWLFLKSQQITNTARTAVRVAVRADDVAVADAQALIDSAMTAAGMPQSKSGYTDTITQETISGVQMQHVQITVPCKKIALINIVLLPLPANLSASVTMAQESP